MEKQELFTKGWVNESEISLQPSNTVRDMLNFRIISDKQNTYSAEIIQGNTIMFTLNPNYRPIGWTLQDNLIAVFSTNDTSAAGGNGEIGVVYVDINTLTAQYYPLYNHPGLHFTQRHMIGKECRIQKENEKIERVYWTDYFNKMGALNLVNPGLNTYLNPSAAIPPSGPIVTGVQYMVLSGAVFYNGQNYGPNVNYPSPSPTVFTGVIGVTTYTVLSGTPIVVIYSPSVNTISTIPNKQLGNIDFKGWVSGGDLPVGEYQIAYQLQTSDGFQTDWSYLSPGVGVTQENAGSTQSLSYPAYVGHPSGVIANKSLQWTINNVDTSFSKIIVAYVATYAYNIANPLGPIIFWDNTINGQSSIVVTLSGNENLGTVPGKGITGLEAEPADVQIVKSITTLKNRLFAGNIKAGFNFDWDPSAGVAVRPCEYLVPSDILAYPTTGTAPGSTSFNLWGQQTDVVAGFAIHGQPNVTTASTVNLFIYKDQWYQVQGTGSIVYNGITYTAGSSTDIFQGIAYMRAFTISSGTPIVVAVIRIQKYSGVYNIVPIVNDFTDSKGMMGDYYLRSLFRTETYRFAVVLWKTEGEPQFAKWMDDITIPAQYSSGIFFTNITGTFNVGDTVTDITTSATATIVAKIGTTGLAITDPSGGSFNGGDSLTSSSGGTATLIPSGQYVNFRLAEPENVELILNNTARFLNPTAGTGRGINMHTSLRQIGIIVDSLDFTTLAANLSATFGFTITYQNLGQYFDGFSIVRAPRDKQLLCQGVWYPTVQQVGGTTTVPMMNDRLGDPANNHDGFSNGNYQFYSPELMFEFNNDAAKPQAGDVWSIADYLTPDPTLVASSSPWQGVEDTGSSFASPVTYHFYNKFYTQNHTINSSDSQLTVASNQPVTPGGMVFAESGAGPLAPSNNGYSFQNFTNRTSGAHNGTGTRSFAVGNMPTYWPLNFDSVSDFYQIRKPIVNYIRPKGNLYGGNSPGALANMLYGYVGHYQAFDAGFMAHLAANSGKAYGIQVFGGDAFVQIFSMQRIMSDPAATQPQESCGVVFPVESTVNTNLRGGDTSVGPNLFFNLVRNFNPGGENYTNGLQWPLKPDQYSINTAYCSTFDNATYIQYPVQPIDFIPATEFQHRVIYSNAKVDGEAIDAYRIFLTANYIDVEGWAGQINNVRAKQGRLLYWQDNAIGYIPVLERELSSNVTGDPVTLGTGGVAQRYDEQKTMYGNQHTHGLAETDSDFYWFDNRRKAFMMANTAGATVEMSVIKGLRSFLKNSVLGAVSVYDNPIYVNFGSYSFGAGIWAEFNGMYKEVVMTFKGVGPLAAGTGNYTNQGDFTIAYNTLEKQFSGRYSFTPGISMDFYDHFITPSPDTAASIIGNTVYNISDVVGQNMINYICILGFTSGIVPSQPASDLTHWLAINSINQIWMHNREQDPSVQVATHYGKVDMAYFTKIYNDKFPLRKLVDTIEQNSDSSFWTTINYSNTNQFGSDVNINPPLNSPDSDFRYIDFAWFFNIPFDNNSGARLVDGWLSANFVKDNRGIDPFTGNISPTISLNDTMKVVSQLYSYRKTY